MYFDIDSLSSEESRKELIEMIEDDANQGRKAESFRQSEILADRFKQFVATGLLGEFSSETVDEMPIIGSINISKKIIDEEAVVYKDAPERIFTNVTEDQEETLNKIYKDGKFNQKLFRSNQNYKYQRQSTLMVIPKKGQLIMRVLKNHHYDVITDEDGEDAIGYIISSYDSSTFLDNTSTRQANSRPTGYESESEQNDASYKYKQRNTEEEFKKKEKQRFIIWTNELNFMMDGHGNILSEEVENPLGRLPFIDIAEIRDDFSFWINQGLSLTDFTVELNQFLSSLFQVIKLQGFAQAIMSGPSEVMPQSMQVGVNHVLKLPVDESSGIETKFDFVSPTPDIEGSLKVLESLLSMYLSTNSIDPKAVSTTGESTTYSSGLERMLAMIEVLSATKEDFDTFTNAEEDLYRLVKDWINVLHGTDTLLPKYSTGMIGDDSEVFVKFQTPDMIQSESEKLANQEKRMDLGISSAVNALMQLDGIPREEAEEQIKQFQEDDEMSGVKEMPAMNALVEDINGQEEIEGDDGIFG